MVLAESEMLRLLGLMGHDVWRIVGGWLSSPVVWVLVGAPVVLLIVGGAAAKLRGNR